MSLDKYKVEASSFEKYYDLFRNNINKGLKYQIKLIDDDNWYVGVPIADALVHIGSLDDVKFKFKCGDEVYYQIPFKVLSSIRGDRCYEDDYDPSPPPEPESYVRRMRVKMGLDWDLETGDWKENRKGEKPYYI